MNHLALAAPAEAVVDEGALSNLIRLTVQTDLSQQIPLEANQNPMKMTAGENVVVDVAFAARELLLHHS
jgi:hypothetical protein